MPKNIYFLIIVTVFVSLSACTSAPEPTPTPRPTNTPFPSVGTDISIDLPEGNADDGKALNGWCTLCHNNLASNRGPDFASADGTQSITMRAADRLADPSYSGNASNVQEYLFESIVDPMIYLAPGEWDMENLMGGGGKFGDFDQSLTVQDIADLIAWMYTIE
jgi:hypothetical protein